LDKIIVGYTGGTTTNPSYRQVCTGTTGHAEAIQITFDPNIVSYEQLVDFFFRMHGEDSLLASFTDPYRPHNA
jgi:methionine-S-sulfoxide reductase